MKIWKLKGKEGEGASELFKKQLNKTCSEAEHKGRLDNASCEGNPSDVDCCCHFSCIDRGGTSEEDATIGWRPACWRLVDRCSGVAHSVCERNASNVGLLFSVHATYIESEEVSEIVPPEKLRKMGMVTIKFSEVVDQLSTALCPFHRELNLNDAHRCMYLGEYGSAIGVDR